MEEDHAKGRLRPRGSERERDEGNLGPIDRGDKAIKRVERPRKSPRLEASVSNIRQDSGVKQRRLGTLGVQKIVVFVPDNSQRASTAPSTRAPTARCVFSDAADSWLVFQDIVVRDRTSRTLLWLLWSEMR